MSIRAVAIVWAESQHKGSALLLMLAIADYAHDDGSNAFPSLPTLASKTRMSHRNVRYLLRDLEASGEIVSDGVTSHGTHRMRIVLPGLKPTPHTPYGPICALCEARPGVNSHHKIPRGLPGSGKKGNLITLCLECHGAMHLPGKQTLTPAGEALAHGAPLSEVRQLLHGGANIAGGQTLPGQPSAAGRQPSAEGGQPSAEGGQPVAPDPSSNHQEPSEDQKQESKEDAWAELQERLRILTRLLSPGGYRLLEPSLYRGDPDGATLRARVESAISEAKRRR